MRSFFIPLSTAALGVTLLFVMAGCVDLKPKPDNTRYFVLDSGTSNVSQGVPSGDVILGMARVTVASYLDTPRIAKRISDVEITYSPTSRWGEDLRIAIQDRVARRIMASGSVREVYTLPWPDGAAPSLRLTIHVDRFEGTMSSEAVLRGFWTLQNPSGTVLQRGNTDQRIPNWVIDDYSDLIVKLDLALDAAAEEIVAAIRTNS